MAALSDRPAPLGQRRWWTLLVLSASLLLIVLDNTIVNTALPALQQGLGLDRRAAVGRRCLRAGASSVSVLDWGLTGDAASTCGSCYSTNSRLRSK
jgi:hypothetical protein